MSIRSPMIASICLAALVAAPFATRAQTPLCPAPAPHAPVPVPVAVVLPVLPALAPWSSPRQTLKTLYFSIIACDFRPSLIDDAVKCLEPLPEQGNSFADAARRAIDLDSVLRELCLPISAVPESTEAPVVELYNADGFKIALRRQPDSTWRFDRDTVERIPLMARQARTMHHEMRAQRTGLLENYTDPSATMHRFMIDAMTGDFYAAAQSLDLSRLPTDQQRDKGPVLAQQLMFVIQRRGWVYFQEIPNGPEGPPYTWYADRDGRIFLERVHMPGGKDAWLFSRNTVKNLDKMYATALSMETDPRFNQLGRVIPPVPPNSLETGQQRPASVSDDLASPRALLRGFFRTMDEAETDERQLVKATEYLDLDGLPASDRPTEGAKLASKLDCILRKLAVDLAAVPDSWNAPTQILGVRQELRVELARLHDGTWKFSRNTVEQLPQLFDKLMAQPGADLSHKAHQETARATMVAFLGNCNSFKLERACRCLDLGAIHSSARDTLGPVLAFKLKYVIDRISRVYPQEIPDEMEGPRYVFHNGESGRIVIARQNDGANKAKWLFAQETVEQIEPMFLAVLGQPVDGSLCGSPAEKHCPTWWETPGIWVRMNIPPWARQDVRGLELYQWIGLLLTFVVSWVFARLLMAVVKLIGCWVLRRSGCAVTGHFVSAKLRPLTWVGTCWLFFKLPALLDLPAAWLSSIMPAEIFLMAGVLGWLGWNVIDLVMAIYTNSERIRPHRTLSDMVVPVSMKILKGILLLLVMTYVIYEVGQGESLLRFFTGLGMAGLAASLAAQDILKSFFGTLLLIGERSFKLGDQIKVDGHEGTVEQVGFRTTRLRMEDGSVVTVPNSTITDSSINTQQSDTAHRHSVSLALDKDLPVEQIASLRDRLETWLQEHAAVIRDETDVRVALHKDGGAELQVNFSLNGGEGIDEASVRQEINYTVLRMVQSVRRSDGLPPVKAGLARAG
jgi:MscS family membrane protein